MYNGFNLNVDTSESSNALYRPAPQKSPLTKQVNCLQYEMPQNQKFVNNPFCYGPEFIKVFSDQNAEPGVRVTFDCVLLGSPRPKVVWLFNEDKMTFTDVDVTDTADVCRIEIRTVQPHHYGRYTVVAENEIGRATATAVLKPPGMVFG